MWFFIACCNGTENRSTFNQPQKIHWREYRKIKIVSANLIFFQNPQCEIVTFETIQTFKGHKPDRTVITKECRDFSTTSDVRKSPSVIRLMRRSVTPHNEATSTNDVRFTERRSVSFSSGTNKSSSHLSIHRNKSPSPALTVKNRSSVLIGDFEMDCLKAHNEFRSKHGAKSLKLSPKLCKFAEEWAINLASRANPIHRSNSPYGENIFCTWSNSPYGLMVEGREPVEHWYGEGESHVFHKEPTTLKTGHFTQVIWKDSRELGVGQARSKTGQLVVVCNYDPPGNFIGSFSENVPPLGGFPSPNKITVELTDNSLSSNEEFNDFVLKMLRWHNYYRRKHGAPILK